MSASPYLALAVGDSYGRFNERIAKRELLKPSSPAPTWFAPLTHEGHLGIQIDGYALYLELELDDDARYATHRFSDIEEMTTAQLGFFNEQNERD